MFLLKFKGVVNMSDDVTCEIKCLEHNVWFPSPIYFGTLEAYNQVATQGNRVSCPIDGKLINCDKSNMRIIWRDENGLLRDYTEGENINKKDKDKKDKDKK